MGALPVAGRYTELACSVDIEKRDAAAVLVRIQQPEKRANPGRLVSGKEPIEALPLARWPYRAAGFAEFAEHHVASVLFVSINLKIISGQQSVGVLAVADGYAELSGSVDVVKYDATAIFFGVHQPEETTDILQQAIGGGFAGCWWLCELASSVGQEEQRDDGFVQCPST